MKLLLTLFLFSLITPGNNKTDFKAFKAAQDYTVPLFHYEPSDKTALFVFPHPDDEIICGGTIHQLKNNGWKIYLLTLTQGNNDEKEIRRAEWNAAGDIFGFDAKEIYDLPNNSWESVLNNTIDFWYTETDSLEHIIFRAVEKYRPSVVFTYDTSFGGYGHPEHRMSAIAVAQVFEKHKSETSFSVEAVLQNTLPEKLEQKMLGGSEPYLNAQRYTGNTTLPDPTVCFDITSDWAIKRKAAMAYSSQADILKKFYLLPDARDTTLHYNTFDREYYYSIP